MSQKNFIENKYFTFSYIILFIPFLEFGYSNLNNIDIQIFSQLVIYFLITFSFFSFLNLTIIKLYKEKPYIYILTFSFIFWLFFRFKSIREFLGGDDLSFSAEISVTLIILFSILFFFLINKTKIYKKYYLFLFLFFILQNIFLSTFILLDYFKFIEPNKIYKNNQKYTQHINKSKKYFSDDEIHLIKKNSNRNIYYFIFNNMTSLDMYQKYTSKKDYEINNIKKKFLNKNFIYVDNSFSSYPFTKNTLGSILQMQPLFTDKLNKYSEIYTDQQYPRPLSKRNFDNNIYPNLIYNLNKLEYKFLWVGHLLGCEVYNPIICIDYVYERKTIFTINKYTLESFLGNTPLTSIYYLFTKKNRFFDKKIKRSDNDDFTYKFFKNHYIESGSNYFYLIHNLLPSGRYSFESNCYLKERIINSELTLDQYLKNYDCALKKISEIIIFLENKDPNAIVVIQGDQGLKVVNNEIESIPGNIDSYKIFNLIKVPKKCHKFVNNNLDNINSTRLAISCATNTKPKLLKRIRLKGL